MLWNNSHVKITNYSLLEEEITDSTGKEDIGFFH